MPYRNAANVPASAARPDAAAAGLAAREHGDADEAGEQTDRAPLADLLAEEHETRPAQ